MSIGTDPETRFAEFISDLKLRESSRLRQMEAFCVMTAEERYNEARTLHFLDEGEIQGLLAAGFVEQVDGGLYRGTPALRWLLGVCGITTY